MESGHFVVQVVDCKQTGGIRNALSSKQHSFNSFALVLCLLFVNYLLLSVYAGLPPKRPSVTAPWRFIFLP